MGLLWTVRSCRFVYGVKFRNRSRLKNWYVIFFSRNQACIYLTTLIQDALIKFSHQVSSKRLLDWLWSFKYFWKKWWPAFSSKRLLWERESFWFALELNNVLTCSLLIVKWKVNLIVFNERGATLIAALMLCYYFVFSASHGLRFHSLCTTSS